MFQFQQPLWLFAIAGILIPVIIHLWNIREGKTLQVGSILLLHQSATSQGRSLRLKDILLLILRCLLIIISAILLAGPAWQKNLISTKEKGWILMERENLQEAYKNFKPVIDSFIKGGYKFHYFNTGFELVNIQDALKIAADTNLRVEDSYWALLKQLNEQVPQELPVYLFTNNSLKRFTGERPIVSMNLNWLTYTTGDTLTKHIVKAYKTNADSIRIFVADSKYTATFYTAENISGNTNNKYKIINNKGKISVVLKNTVTVNPVEVDTSYLQVIIYTDQFTTDANYLKAAIDAIAGYTGLKIKISITNNAGNIKPVDDWLFWLSEKSLPLQKLPSKIFTYEKGKEQTVNSWITGGNYFFLNAEKIHLSRLIKNNITGDNMEHIWTDGFGHTILGLQKNSNYTWHFYSRFDPAWNDLPWSQQFPEMIFDILIKKDIPIKKFDNRIVDAYQLKPEITNGKKIFPREKFIEKTDLTKLFWLIAFIIVCLERYISLNNKSEVYA